MVTNYTEIFTVLEGRYPALHHDGEIDFIQEPLAGLAVGEEVHSIGAPPKSGKWGSAARLAEFEPPIIYMGKLQAVVDVNMGESLFAVFKVPQEGLAGVNLFNFHKTVYLLFIIPDAKVLWWQDYAALNIYQYKAVFNKHFLKLTNKTSK